MEDCITISDDEIEIIEQVVNLEPFTIDLTKDRQRRRTKGYSTQPEPKKAHPESNDTSHFQQEEACPEPKEAQTQSGLFHSQPKFFNPEPKLFRPRAEQTNSETQKVHLQSRLFHPRPGLFHPEPKLSQPQSQETHPQPEEHQPQAKKSNPGQDSFCPQAEPTHSQPDEAHPEPAVVQSQPEKSHLKPDVNSFRPEKTETEPESKPTVSDHDLMISLKALGNEKYKHNLFDDAIRIYKRANELAKKLGNKEMSAILHFNLAMTYYRLGSFDQAADECANAVKLDDNYSKAHLKRAEIYQRQKKFDEAVICYEHICELDSTNQDYAILLYHAKEAAKRLKKKDHYQLLGLKYNFTHEDLKKAYRQSALTHHPDRHSDADVVSRRIHEKRFKDASEAHTFLQLRLGGIHR